MAMRFTFLFFRCKPPLGKFVELARGLGGNMFGSCFRLGGGCSRRHLCDGILRLSFSLRLIAQILFSNSVIASSVTTTKRRSLPRSSSALAEPFLRACSSQPDGI